MQNPRKIDAGVEKTQQSPLLYAPAAPFNKNIYRRGVD
jgi:hypothetical protein